MESSKIMSRLSEKLRVLKKYSDEYEEKNHYPAPYGFDYRLYGAVADYVLICRKGMMSIGLFIHYKHKNPCFYATFSTLEKNKYTAKYEAKKIFYSMPSCNFDDFAEKLRLVCRETSSASFLNYFVRIMDIKISPHSKEELENLKSELSEESRLLSKSITTTEQQIDVIHDDLDLSRHEKELKDLRELLKKKEKEVKKIKDQTKDLQKENDVKRRKLVKVNKNLEDYSLLLKFYD